MTDQDSNQLYNEMDSNMQRMKSSLQQGTYVLVSLVHSKMIESGKQEELLATYREITDKLLNAEQSTSTEIVDKDSVTKIYHEAFKKIADQV
jgi:hypothetical protein